MKTTTTTCTKWLLLLAMALVGCDFTETPMYPCSVVQSRNGWLKYCYGDSVTMLTSHHAIVYRDGASMHVKDNENLLNVECHPFKVKKP